MKFYCTLFDVNYLIKGLTMIHSLLAHNPNTMIYVLCMDNHCLSLLKSLDLKNVHLIDLQSIETEELLEVKDQRTKAEYCWTLSPSLMSYLFNTYPEIDQLTYLDADLFFYNDVSEIFSEIGDSQIAIIEHRFSKHLIRLEKFGLFCVEWVSICRKPQGLACLERWRDQCIAWCKSILEDDKFGDQKYLDEWPLRYDSICIIEHHGAGLAPWNFDQYRISKSPSGELLSNSVKCIFYHFHQFQIIDVGEFDWISKKYINQSMPSHLLYRPYESAFMASLNQIRLIESNFSAGFQDRKRLKLRRLVQRFVPDVIKSKLERFAFAS